MGQPAIVGMTLNAGSGGIDLAMVSYAGEYYQAALLCYWDGASAPVVIEPTSGMPVALSAETTKVIGTVNIAAAQTIAAVTAITNALPAGDNNIGNVDVASLPALPTGSNVIGGVTQSGTWTVTGAGGVFPVTNADLTTLAGMVSGGHGQVDVLTMPTVTVTGTVGVTGTFWQATQPISAASLPLPTGAATESTLSALNGKVTACNTGAVVIASGTVTTITNVVHVDDNSSTLSIDDGGGAITVDGTVAVSGSVAVTGTFWQATQPVSGTVAVTNADLTTLAGMVSGGHGQVDVLTMPTVAVTGTFWQATQPVSLASVPSHAVTNAGTFAVQVDGAALTALQLIDNCISGNEAQVDVVAALPAGTNTIGGVIAQQSTSAAYDGTTSCTLKRATGIATGSGANTILTAVADKKFRVLALSLIATSTTAVVCYLYNGDYMLLGDSTNKITLDMDGGGGPAGLVLPFNPGGWMQTDTANEALAINLGAATPVIWAITYIEVS